MQIPNIHRENYLLALASRNNLKLSDSEVAILRDIYISSLPITQQHTDMWSRINYLPTAIKQARVALGVDTKV